MSAFINCSTLSIGLWSSAWASFVPLLLLLYLFILLPIQFLLLIWSTRFVIVIQLWEHIWVTFTIFIFWIAAGAFLHNVLLFILQCLEGSMSSCMMLMLCSEVWIFKSKKISIFVQYIYNRATEISEILDIPITFKVFYFFTVFESFWVVHTVRNLHFLSKKSTLISRENLSIFSGWKTRENFLVWTF